MTPWEAAGYASQEEWAAAGWPAPIDPDTGKSWEGWKMHRMERGFHPYGGKMKDEHWFQPYTQAILDFVRVRRLYDNPLWGWAQEMRAKYPQYPMPGVNIEDLLRKAFPDWYEEEKAPAEAPTRAPAPSVRAGIGFEPGVVAPTPQRAPEKAVRAPSGVRSWLGWVEGWEGARPEREMGEITEALQPFLGFPETWEEYVAPKKPFVPEALLPPTERAPVAKVTPIEQLVERAKGLFARPKAIEPEVPKPEVVEEKPAPLVPTIERVAERLWPGWLQGIQQRIVEPAEDIIPGLQRDANELLGSFNAAVHGVPEMPKLETPGRLWEMTRGAYSAWFTPIFDVFERVDNAKNAVLSVYARAIEKQPITTTMQIQQAMTGVMPTVSPEMHERLVEEASQGALSREEIEEAVHEGERLFATLFVEPSAKEEMREQIRSGEVTLDEAISDYTLLPAGAEMLMEIGTSAWWYPLPGAGPFMKIAFAPISVPMKGLWRAAKNNPITSHLVQWSKMTRVNRAGDDAVNAYRKMMREVAGPTDVPFSGPQKARIQLFADDLANIVEREREAIAERFPHLTDNEINSISKIFEQAKILGIDPRQILATASSKGNAFSRVRWMARLQRASELGISLEADPTLAGEARAMLMDLWLSGSFKYIVNNTIDDFSKAVMHGYYPNPLGAGNYIEEAGRYGWDLPEFVEQTQLAQLRGARRVSSIGRLGLPLVSRPEHWATGYAGDFLEMILGKKTANQLISKATQSVMLLHDPQAGLLKKVLASVIDNANVETFFWAGRELNYTFQRGLRGGVFVQAATEHIGLKQGEWIDDIARFAEEAGWSADDIGRLRSYLNSPFVRSVDDAVARANLALGGEEGMTVYGLSDHKILAQGKTGEPLLWIADDLQRLEQAGRATEEIVRRTFDTGRRMIENVMGAVDDVAKGQTPVSSVLDDILDIKGIQEGRRGVARDYLHTTMTQIEKAWVEGQITDDAYEAARQISRQTETKAGGLVGRMWEKENEALLKLNQQIEDLAGMYRKGQIDVVEFSIRKGQAIYDYMWGKTAIRTGWDKVNDKYVKVVQAGAYRMQRATGIYPESLSAELTMQLAKYQRIESRIQETFKRDFLGKILNDAEKALDEVGRWEEEALGKLRPAEAVAPEVAEEVAKPDRAPLINHIMESWQSLLDEAEQVGTEMVDHIMFNYGDKTVAQEGAQRWFIPFVTWQIRNPLYYLQHFQEIPGLLNAVRLIETKTDEMRQERGLSARFKYTLPITGAMEFVPGMPEGYYGMDIRPFISIMSQVGIFNPFGEPYKWSEETSLGKLARAGEWLGMSSYPWWQYVLRQFDIGESPDLAYISPITRAVRDWTGIDIGHITEQDKYYAALELAGRVVIGEISKLDAMKAIYAGYETGEPNELWDDAFAVSQDQMKRVDRIAMWLPGALKYASTNELAVRERLGEFWDQPPTQPVNWEEWPGVSTYFFIWSSPEEKQELLGYEEQSQRIEQLNSALLSAAQDRRVGDRWWRKQTDEYWQAREEISADYEGLEGKEDRYHLMVTLRSPTQQVVQGYRSIAESYLDPETGELKEGYDWGDVVAAQEGFRAELVMGTPDRSPMSLTLFDQALYYWEPIAMAKLRAWELLYGKPAWKVIADTKDLENRNDLIAEAKRLANSGRNNDAELMAEILRVHPEWTKEQVAEAMKVKLADWDAWSRKSQPLHDALTGIMWANYMALNDLARKEFRQFIEDEPDIDPRIAILFEKIILPKEMEKNKQIWYRDMKLVSPKVLLILVDRLNGLRQLKEEGFLEEIQEAEKEWKLEPIEPSIQPPTPGTERLPGVTPPGHPQRLPWSYYQRTGRKIGIAESFWDSLKEKYPISSAWKERVMTTRPTVDFLTEWAGYYPGGGEIVSKQPFGSWSTYEHELGHAMDDMLGKDGPISRTTEWQEAIKRWRDDERYSESGLGIWRYITEFHPHGSKEKPAWNEAYAEAATYPFSRIPTYIRKFYPWRDWRAMEENEKRGVFGEQSVAERDRLFQREVIIQKSIDAGIEATDLERFFGGNHQEHLIPALVHAWHYGKFETPEKAQVAWEAIPQADREKALEWFSKIVWPIVKDDPGDWQVVKDFLDFIGIAVPGANTKAGRPPGKASIMPSPPEAPGLTPPGPTEGAVGVPPGEEPESRYGERVFTPTATPQEEAEYDQALREMQAWVAAGKTSKWTPLMEKWFGKETPAGNFWEYYWAEIPPGRIADDLRSDPIIEMLLNKAFRTVYDVKPGVYEQALTTLKTWREAHPELPGDPQEWAIVRQITNKYWELKNAGATNEASALWRYFSALLEKYYPSQRAEVTPRRTRTYRRRRPSAWSMWGRGWRRWPRIRYYPRR